jgi:hypothetical protein
MSPFPLPSLKQKVESQKGYLIHGLAIYMLGPSQRSAYIEKHHMQDSGYVIVFEFYWKSK